MSVETRAAAETDAPRIAELLDLPEPAARRLVRTRSVELAIDADEATGCLSFDVHDGVIEVTRLAGAPETIRRLLDAPRRLARADDRPIEVLLPEAAEDTATVLTDDGFEASGRGPRFRGRATTRYRWEPPDD